MDAGIDGERPTVNFGPLLENVLEDAQARLVFLAQKYIDNDIQHFQPSPKDFELRPALDISKSSVVLEASSHNANPSDYAPATLTIEEDSSDTQSIAPSSEPSYPTDSSGSPLGEGTDVSRGWYPTLQKTLWILSKLYQTVQTNVFEDLAQDAISICMTSLKEAGETLTTTKSRLDGQLFLIKHFLVLKEQLAPFDANFVHSTKTLDFSHVTDTLSSFQQNRSLIFNPNALISLAQQGMPRVVDISLDSRREIDRELKRACEDFINDCVRGAVEPLSTFMIKTTTVRPTQTAARQQTIDAAEVEDTVKQFKEAAGERIRFVVRKLREYVSDNKIEQILMKPIEANITEQYRLFYQTVTSNQGETHITLQSVEDTAMWLSQLKQTPQEEHESIS